MNQSSYRSPKSPPKNHQRQAKNLSPQKPEPIKQKLEDSIEQSRKIHINIKVNNERSERTSKLPAAIFNSF